MYERCFGLKHRFSPKDLENVDTSMESIVAQSILSMKIARQYPSNSNSLNIIPLQVVDDVAATLSVEQGSKRPRGE